MNTGRAPAAPAANHAWPNLFVSLAPDVADAGDTGPALTEAQFAALVRVLALANARRTSVASGVRTVGNELLSTPQARAAC